MSGEPTPKAGTTAGDGGEGGSDAVKPGTPDAAGRDTAAGKEPDYKALHLASKDKLEKFNDMEKQLAEAREELRSGRQPAPAETDDMRGEIEELEAENIELSRLARAGDLMARKLLRLNNDLIQTRQDTIDGFSLHALPEAKRAAAFKLYEANRGKFKNLGEAADYLARQDERKELDRLKAENEELKKGGGKPKADDADDVVRTGGRDYSIATRKAPTMSKKDFDARQQQLKGAGDHKLAMQEQGELAAGKIVLKD